MRKCVERNDEWGNEVRIRIQDALIDLHAADAQYHHDCLHRFESNAGPSQSEETLDEDTTFTMVVDLMPVDKWKIWKTI